MICQHHAFVLISIFSPDGGTVRRYSIYGFEPIEACIACGFISVREYVAFLEVYESLKNLLSDMEYNSQLLNFPIIPPPVMPKPVDNCLFSQNVQLYISSLGTNIQVESKF